MISNTHIASAFDRDLETIQGLIMKMGGMVEEAIENASTALLDSDLDLANATRRGDKAIDALELRVNEEAARLIALRQPIATDLRTVLSVFRISAALERVGDYAKNIAKRTEILQELHPVEGGTASLKRMSKAVQTMLKDALDAYIQRDSALAYDVRARDEEVDQMYNGLFREYLTHMMENPRNITACMHLHFMAKNIERMGDLVTGIAEQVIYLVDGVLPDEDRTKADITSTTRGGTVK
ncbi:MAG: phosphate signaling complex protein PhoU [Jannaschia helgolandensis]|jgi:phosphate transport system protein|uniref:Phosphate-specific transport system accessory protein PhoU n=1 Tax=Jannaschia helgolandensis TaxID=188906 RepID=A0A1H7KUB8_9RHOB|nr:phosphate signaling complex protein PhoU [Jannaschia helgolandensis]SEK89665.1 phosphate uptake regulator, PhoU [Jannaschia helgolandensis]|tara:strand:- start:1073 stop:1792 length:720 start_codon:yes stop_codon:yes gene_type:complete